MGNYLSVFLLLALLILLVSGCSRKQSTASAAAELENAFHTKAATPAAPAPAPEVAPAAPAPAPQGDEVKQSVNRAVIAIRTNGFVEAFHTLRSVQASPGLTLDQYTAIQNARIALDREMAAKAEAGDAAAAKALQQISKSGN
jgi:hypothetical protein